MDGSVESGQPDPTALFTLAYRQHAAAVLAYLRSQGVEDPEAVTQDTFVALHPRLTSLSGGAAGLRTLIFSIAHARVVDHRRHRARVPLPVEYDPATDTRVTPSAEDHVVNDLSGPFALLAPLLPEHREVLALRVIADLSIDETARIMNRTPGAIKQLQRRALAALREHVALDAEGAR